MPSVAQPKPPTKALPEKEANKPIREEASSESESESDVGSGSEELGSSESESKESGMCCLLFY